MLFVSAARATPPPEDDALKKALNGITEKIFEAIRTGNERLLERHLAPEMILINQDGKEYSRENLVDELVPPRDEA